MYTHILHATDLSETHFDLCKQAVEIAKKFDARLYLLHVIEPPASLQIAQGLGFAEFDEPVKEDARAVLQTMGEAFGLSEDQLFVETGSIKAQTIAKISALGCDLLIIGSHHQSMLSTIAGNTARELHDSATCDVLTIKGR
jgi:nucleotide-binding universal stress UspA family protein